MASNGVSALQGTSPALGFDLADGRSNRVQARFDDFEAREASLRLRARELSLSLGRLLIVAGILAALLIAAFGHGEIAPIGLISGGIALIRFGGRSLDARHG
jgi:hypothetical protein